MLSVLLHGIVLLALPSLSYLAATERAARPFSVSSVPEQPPASEPLEPPEELEVAPPPLPDEPALLDAEFEPEREPESPPAPAPRVAAGAALAHAFEPDFGALRWGPRRARAGESGGAAAGGEGGAPATEQGAPAPIPGTLARARTCPEPGYPALSRRRREQGVVLVRLWIDDHGLVAHAELEQSSGHARLDQAALDGVLAWRFDPATENGEPVDSQLVWRVVFRLERGA